MGPCQGFKHLVNYWDSVEEMGGLLVGDRLSLQLRVCLGGDVQGREEAAGMMLTALSKE